MIFEQINEWERVGERAGYVFSYFVFTTILFFILTFLNKIPISWSYVHVMGITILIAVLGIVSISHNKDFFLYLWFRTHSSP